MDINSRAELAAALAATMHGRGDFVVDLSGASFIDVEGRGCSSAPPEA